MFSMCEWSSSYASNYKCVVLPEEGSSLCILHQPMPKDCALFKKKFYEQLDQIGSPDARNPLFDFTGYVFPEMLSLQGPEALLSREGTSVVIPGTINHDLILECAWAPHAVDIKDLVINGSLRARRLRCSNKVWLTGAKISEDVDMRWAVFEGDVRFHGATFGRDGRNDATFERCRFLDGVSFNQSHFRGMAMFNDALFRGAARFSSCVFHTPARFSGAHFSKKATFNSATFKAEGAFLETRFKKGANFHSAQFPDQAIFQAAKFGHQTCFDNATIGRAHFNSAQFRGRVSFTEFSVEKHADFSKTVFAPHPLAGQSDRPANEDGTANFSNAVFSGPADFLNAKFKGDAHFVGARFERGLRLQDASFLGATNFEMAESSIIEVGSGRPRTYGFGLGAPRCGFSVSDETTATSLWHLVRWTFEKQGKRSEADAAFYFERVWRWRDRLRHGGIRRFGAAFLWPFDLLLRAISGYGTNLFRLLTTWLFTIVGFAVAYRLLPGAIAITKNASIGTSCLEKWLVSLHFSVTTFTTLGLGDLMPGRMWARALVSLEATIGAILMALTVLVIGRKFMR